MDNEREATMRAEISRLREVIREYEAEISRLCDVVEYWEQRQKKLSEFMDSIMAEVRKIRNE